MVIDYEDRSALRLAPGPARLRRNACVEDVDHHIERGLDRTLLKLSSGDFIRERRNVLITGKCGVGKSWLACALGHKV
jgi:DNA replication protein DnaC